jgi:3-oxoacyl-[acyl-carrier protein] reductase
MKNSFIKNSFFKILILLLLIQISQDINAIEISTRCINYIKLNLRQYVNINRGYSLHKKNFNNCSNVSRRLDGKVSIITGGSKGIGAEVASLFAEEGATVVIVSRTENTLEKVVEKITQNGGKASYIVGDVSNSKDMINMAERTFKDFGRIDILIHNAAGIYPPSRIDEMSDEEWNKAILTNLNGTFYAVKSVVPYMEKQNYGKIVFTSSISGPRVGLPTKSHYTASKGGMNGFMKTIAIELARYNITVNAVEPGNIMTDGLESNNSLEALKDRIDSIPMKRLGTPREVAQAHLFLASDESNYITGQSIIIDGGQILPETRFGW